MSNDRIDHWYDLAMQNGALGGKLIGAGGGGFLMFLCRGAGAGAAGDGRRRAWRRSGSGSTSRAPRWSSNEPVSGRRPGRRPGHPAGAADPARRPSAWSRSPAGRSSTTSSGSSTARGCGEVVLCLGHLGEQVVEVVGDGSAFGLEVAYSFDGPELRGTAGAIRRALPLLGEAFFVLYGDSYLECDYAAVQRRFEAAGKLALMTVFRNEGRWDTSNVEFRDGRILAYDKVDRTRGHAVHRLRPGGLRPAGLRRRRPRRGRTTWRRSTRRCSGGVELAGLRGHRTVLRDRLGRGARRDAATPGRAELKGLPAREVHDVACGAVSRPRPSRSSTAWTSRPSSRWRRSWSRPAERGGRLFILGVGGSAANASHAVNDFRKIVGIEAYAPTDNVSELTARTNDEGWATIFVEWLRVSRLKPEDLILVLSVGGGNLEKNVSPNLVTALQYAQEVGTPVIGIVGKDGGYTAQGGRRLRDRADGQPRPRHAALRGVPGGRLAPARLAPAAQGAGRRSGNRSDEPRSARRGSGERSSSTATACLNRGVVRDGRPYPPATLEAVRDPAGRGRGGAPAPRRRLPADRARPTSPTSPAAPSAARSSRR